MKSVASTSLNVASGGGIYFEFGIDVEISIDDVPSACVGESARCTGKGILPNAVEATIARGIPGKCGS